MVLWNKDIGLNSHMFEGCGKWSDTQDYQLWKRNLQSFCENIVWKDMLIKIFGEDRRK